MFFSAQPQPYPRGQGLLEATLAIGMILVGLGAVLTLTIQNVSATASSSQRLMAAQLAREGIEVARAVRDTNWLAANNSRPTQLWDDGVCSNNFAACKLASDCAVGGVCRLLRDADDCGSACNGAVVEFIPGVPGSPPQAAAMSLTMLSLVYVGAQSRDVDDSAMPVLELYRGGVAEGYWWVQVSSLPAPAGYSATGYRRLVLLDPVCRSSDGLTVRTEVASQDCFDSTWTKIGIRVESIVSYPSAGVFGGQGRRRLSLVEYLYNWR